MIGLGTARRGLQNEQRWADISYYECKYHYLLVSQCSQTHGLFDVLRLPCGRRDSHLGNHITQRHSDRKHE
jgi:hypothetical protein